MNALYDFVERWLERINRVCLGVSTGLLAAMLAVVTLNVILRYIFHYSITWTEESARFMMVWIAFLLFPYAQHKGQLVAVDFLIQRIRYSRAGVVLAIVLELLTILVLVVCFKESIGFVQRATSTISMALQLPMWMVSLVMPASFALTLVASILWIVRLFCCLADPERLRAADAVRSETMRDCC